MNTYLSSAVVVSYSPDADSKHMDLRKRPGSFV